MARERAFSDQQVIEAANALLVEGKNINGTSLRNKIGTGRPSVLMSVFKALEDSGEILAPMLPDSTEQTITHQELPPEIAERLLVMLNNLFTRSTITLITLLSSVLTKPLQKQTNVLLMLQSAKRNRFKSKIKRSSN